MKTKQDLSGMTLPDPDRLPPERERASDGAAVSVTTEAPHTHTADERLDIIPGDLDGARAPEQDGREEAPRQAAEFLPAPPLARVVHVAHRFPLGLSLHRDPSAYLLSPASLLTRRAEDFRQLRAQLKMQLGNSGVLLMVSPRHGEGRSITALNLGIAFAQEFTRVLYVEADFRRPALHTYFELPAGKGTADLLRERRPIDDVGAHVLATDVPGLYLLPAGVRSGTPELLESPRVAELVKRLRVEADWTIVDCPPLLSYADALPLIPLVDGIVIVALQGRTREADLASLAERLASAHARVVGAVYVEH